MDGGGSEDQGEARVEERSPGWFLRSWGGAPGRHIRYMRRGHGGWCAVHEEEDRLVAGPWAAAGRKKLGRRKR